MVFVLAAARSLKILDARYDRTFTLHPNELIVDPYLIELVQRAKIRLRYPTRGDFWPEPH
jgi:hypothetical protein